MIRHSFYTILLTIATLFSFSSCSVDDYFDDLQCPPNDEPELQERGMASRQNGAEIMFSVKSDVPARSAEDGNIPLSFRITAYDGIVNYFDCRSDFVTSCDKGNSWTSDHCRYWPGNPDNDWKGLDFYAFSIVGERDMTPDANGADVEFEFSKDVPSVRNFKVSSDVRCQNDLLYAVAANVRNGGANDKVDLYFRHALSKVAFQISNDNSAYDNVEILSVEIGGVKGIGDYSFPKKKEANESLITFSDKKEGGVWTIPSSAEDEVFAITDLNVNLAGPDMSESGSYLSDSMLMIPQIVEAWSEGAAEYGSYIRVIMQVTPKGCSNTREDTIFVPISINWKEGKSYLYTISIDSPFISVCECESEFK